MENSNDNINYQTQQNTNNVYNNMSSMNQLNQNIMNMDPNTLYIQNFQQTWQNMQQNVNLIQTNFNNMTNILSLLNLPIIVPYHNEHPLINCKTPGRDRGNNCWKCNNCSVLYSYSVPTFFCTACDFDFCQKCLLSLNSYLIVIYNYTQGTCQNFFSEDFLKSKYYKPNIHNHPIVKIVREPCYFENRLRCNFCLKDLQQQEQFYYCSLCNYCICVNCYAKKEEGFIDNKDYFSENQLSKYNQ